MLHDSFLDKKPPNVWRKFQKRLCYADNSMEATVPVVDTLQLCTEGSPCCQYILSLAKSHRPKRIPENFQLHF